MTKFKITNERNVPDDLVDLFISKYDDDKKSAYTAGKVFNKTPQDYIESVFTGNIRRFIREKEQAGKLSVLSIDAFDSYLDVPVDDAGSNNFYIRDETLYFGDAWLGTLANDNEEVYLNGGALKTISKYTHPEEKAAPSLEKPIPTAPKKQHGIAGSVSGIARSQDVRSLALNGLFKDYARDRAVGESKKPIKSPNSVSNALCTPWNLFG